jgi:hypothetical protein
MKTYVEPVPAKQRILAYTIERTNDTIYITQYFYQDHFKEFSEVPEHQKNSFYMHVGNVPELLTTIMTVFQTETFEGGFREVIGYGEQIDVDMDTDRMSQFELSLTRVKPELYFAPFINFALTGHEICSYPKKRKPTKAMTWVMSELETEYKKWKKEQKNEN